MVDIYCKDNKCPICRSDLKSTYPDYVHNTLRKCGNGCYSIFIGFHTVNITIFNKPKRFRKEITSNMLSFSDANMIVNEIGYWMENEKYLIKLLESC